MKPLFGFAGVQLCRNAAFQVACEMVRLRLSCQNETTSGRSSSMIGSTLTTGGRRLSAASGDGATARWRWPSVLVSACSSISGSLVTPFSSRRKK